MTPFKAPKGATFEGGFRVPAIIRWPGRIKPGTVENGIFSGPRLAAHARGRRWQPRHQGSAPELSSIEIQPITDVSKFFSQRILSKMF
jgi:hypothetical protein